MKRLLLAAALLLIVVGLAGPATAAPQHESAQWRVTVENLTPDGSQRRSPPGRRPVGQGRRWSVGSIANHGVAAIAEDANNAVLEEVLPEQSGVSDVFTLPGGPIPSGASRTFDIESRGRFDRFTLLTMLVNTNDAFTGLDSTRLRGRGERVRTAAYDAGSERNNELASFIPGPCCNNPFVRDPEGALIRHHEGITGVGDLDPAVNGWIGPAARIIIERVP